MTTVGFTVVRKCLAFIINVPAAATHAALWTAPANGLIRNAVMTYQYGPTTYATSGGSNRLYGYLYRRAGSNIGHNGFSSGSTVSNNDAHILICADRLPSQLVKYEDTGYVLGMRWHTRQAILYARTDILMTSGNTLHSFAQTGAASAVALMTGLLTFDWVVATTGTLTAFPGYLPSTNMVYLQIAATGTELVPGSQTLVSCSTTQHKRLSRVHIRLWGSVTQIAETADTGDLPHAITIVAKVVTSAIDLTSPTSLWTTTPQTNVAGTIGAYTGTYSSPNAITGKSYILAKHLWVYSYDAWGVSAMDRNTANDGWLVSLDTVNLGPGESIVVWTTNYGRAAEICNVGGYGMYCLDQTDVV